MIADADDEPMRAQKVLSIVISSSSANTRLRSASYDGQAVSPLLDFFVMQPTSVRQSGPPFDSDVLVAPGGN